MTPESPKFVSEWITTPRDAETFAGNFEKSRNVHIRPLTHAYTHLVNELDLKNTDLLCLGIGTGKVEQIMGLNSERISAIDYNQSLLDKAQTRLPHARLFQGRIEDTIELIGAAPTVLTQEALDCIPPSELPDLMKKIRDKTDKFVAIQSYSPDPEYYASSFVAGHAIGGPGIESATIHQQEVLEARLRTLGVQSDIDEPQEMLIQLQSYVEKIIGTRFSVNIVSVLEQLNYPFNQKFPQRAGLRSLSAQASLLLNSVELKAEELKNIFRNNFANRPREGGIYIGMDTTHRFLQLLLGTYRIDTYLQLLADAASQAGFGDIELSAVSATQKRVVTPQELVSQFNRSLEVTHRPVSRKIRTDDKSSRAFVGSPLILMEPSENPYSIARVPYLTAA